MDGKMISKVTPLQYVSVARGWSLPTTKFVGPTPAAEGTSWNFHICRDQQGKTALGSRWYKGWVTAVDRISGQMEAILETTMFAAYAVDELHGHSSGGQAASHSKENTREAALEDRQRHTQ